MTANYELNLNNKNIRIIIIIMHIIIIIINILIHNMNSQCNSSKACIMNKIKIIILKMTLKLKIIKSISNQFKNKS